MQQDSHLHSTVIILLAGWVPRGDVLHPCGSTATREHQGLAREPQPSVLARGVSWQKQQLSFLPSISHYLHRG